MIVFIFNVLKKKNKLVEWYKFFGNILSCMKRIIVYILC